MNLLPTAATLPTVLVLMARRTIPTIDLKIRLSLGLKILLTRLVLLLDRVVWEVRGEPLEEEELLLQHVNHHFLLILDLPLTTTLLLPQRQQPTVEVVGPLLTMERTNEI